MYVCIYVCIYLYLYIYVCVYLFLCIYSSITLFHFYILLYRFLEKFFNFRLTEVKFLYFSDI